MKLSIDKYITKKNSETITGRNNKTKDEKEFNGSPGPVAVDLGNTVTFTIPIVNSGNGDASNVEFYDEYNDVFSNPSTTNISISGASWLSEPTIDTTNRKISGKINNIGAGKTVTVTITLTVKTDAKYIGSKGQNKATYTYNNKSGYAYDFVKIKNPIQYDKYITYATSKGNVTGRGGKTNETKEASPVKVGLGNTVTFTIPIKNNGTGTVTNLEIIDQFQTAAFSKPTYNTTSSSDIKISGGIVLWKM